MMMFRHLPPTATPLPLTTLARATTPDVDAIANFETEFAAAMQVSAALTASTGRTALYLLLMSLKAAQGSQSNRCEVLLPAYTCPSLVKVIQECELTATPIEMDPATFEFDRGAFAAALSERTLAVIHVHPFGVPQPIRWLLSAVRSSGAVVIEDAAQSMGARLNDSYVGTSGDFGLYSLGPGKPLSAGGGGIMTVNHSRCSSELTESWRQLPAIRRRDSWIAVGRLAAMNAAFEPRGLVAGDAGRCPEHGR